MIETRVPQSAGWWLARLGRRLAELRPRYDRLDAYYRNEAGIPVTANKAVRDAYRRLMAMSMLNLAELIVEAPRERMQPVGFRTGADGDPTTDQQAWRIWQANHLDADNALVHRAMLSMGDAYVMVGVNEDGPVITPEDPRQVITEQDPVRRRRAIAALKLFRDTTVGYDRAYLFLPGTVQQAARPIRDVDKPFETQIGDDWEWVTDPVELGTRQIPVVRFTNRADMQGVGCGEYERHTSNLDRINYTILNRLEIATLQAFKQRAIQGVPALDEHGSEINYDNIFAADPGALWLLPETAKIWESQEVNLDGIRQGLKDDIQNLAAVTRTPLFYLAPDAANGSAEGASLAREGLVFKTEDLIANASESWEQVIAMALEFDGTSPRTDMQVVWAPAERFTLAERYDAASKASMAGVPWRQVMESVLQFSPQEIDRMEADRATDSFLTSNA